MGWAWRSTIASGGRRLPARLIENRKIERFARPKPDHVSTVVDQILAGIGMGEDGKPVTIERRPARECTENLDRHGKLAASARMRSDRLPMKTADSDTEQRMRAIRQRPRLAQFAAIEIDMGMELANIRDRMRVQAFTESLRRWA